MGIHIFYAFTSKERMQEIQKKIDVMMDTFHIKISDYQTNPLNTLKEFIPLGEWNYHQCRLFLNEDIKNTVPVANQSSLNREDWSSTNNRNEFFM